MMDKINGTLVVLVALVLGYVQLFYAKLIAEIIFIVAYGTVGVLAVVIIGAVGVGAFYLREKHLLLRASRQMAQRDASVMVITASKDEQVMVKEFGTVQGPNDWQVFLNRGENSMALPLITPDLTILPEPVATLPDKILLPDILPSSGPSLNNITLGVALNKHGQTQPVTAPLSKLVHVAIGGSSGWGKSILLQSLAYQVALAPEPAELALIDLEAATFSPFATSDRLRYAIADTEDDANRILVDLIGELKKRKELFRQHPTVDSLDSYNKIAEGRLPVVALMIDESTALLGDKTIEANIKTLALRARKYGIYAVLGGQDWKASSLDSAIKNQLSTKIQLKAQSAAQSRVLLGDGAARAIEKPGRAYAITPGERMKEIQTPYISLPMLMTALSSVSTAQLEPAPVVIKPSPAPTPRQSEILAAYDGGCHNIGEIMNTLGMTDGGKQRTRIKGTLRAFRGV